MLPGGGRHGDGDAARDRDGQEQLPVPGVAGRAAQSEDDDDGGEDQEQGDLQRPLEPEAQQRAVQGLVGQAVRPFAESGTREMVHPVRPRVTRHHRPGQRRADDERDTAAHGRPASSGEPEQGGEEQDCGLEGSCDTGQHTGKTLTAYRETGEQHQQDGQDAGLAQVQRVADGQRHHQQGDRDGRREERGAPAHGCGQGAHGDEAEQHDEQQGAEGPDDAEGLFGRDRQRLQHQSGERCAGEAARVVERPRDVQDPGRPGPGLQVGEAFAGRAAQHHRHLPYRQDPHEQPEDGPDHRGPRSGIPRRVPPHTALHICHAAPTLPFPCTVPSARVCADEASHCPMR